MFLQSVTYSVFPQSVTYSVFLQSVLDIGVGGELLLTLLEGEFGLAHLVIKLLLRDHKLQLQQLDGGSCHYSLYKHSRCTVQYCGQELNKKMHVFRL